MTRSDVETWMGSLTLFFALGFLAALLTKNDGAMVVLGSGAGWFAIITGLLIMQDLRR